MVVREVLLASPWVLLGLAIAYPIIIGIYRVYFHPLSHIPGPKIAAFTWWYEYYFDCVQKGQYIWQIERLHAQYGPIIRINPHEVHCSDPDYFGEIYTQTKKRDVWSWAKKGFGIDVSTLTTINHDLHKRRRAALNPLFSKQRIVRLQPVIQEKLDFLLERIWKAGQAGNEVNVKLGVAAFTADVAMEYFFGRSQNKLAVDDFDGAFHDAVNSGFNNMPFLNHWPWIMSTMRGIAAIAPRWLLARFAQGKMTSFIAAQKQIAIQVREALAKKTPLGEDNPKATMYDTLLSSKLPDEEKTFTRLVQEGGLMVGAATVSTAWAITSTLYCLIAHPEALEKLKKELIEAYPEGAHQIGDLATLEHLPYLQAAIQEGLRISIGASHRSPRVAYEPLLFVDKKTGKSHNIPAGTPMSMSHVLLFRDESIFPDHAAFKPERWIENPGLDKYQFAFSKGTRQCPGINLAMCEIELIVAHLFRRYGSAGCSMAGDIGKIELFETDWTDLECIGDGGVPLVKPDSKGVRIKIIPAEEQDTEKVDTIETQHILGLGENSSSETLVDTSTITAAGKVQSDLDNYQQFVAKKLDVLALDTRPAVATHMNWSSASTRIPAACIA